MEVPDSTAHVRFIHVDAPVTEVFDHLTNPASFVEADPEPVALTKAPLAPASVGATWETSFRVLGLPVRAHWTRREFVAGQRIVDHASTGVTWTYTTTPEGEGTRLSLGYQIDTPLPAVNGILDRVFGNQVPQLDTMLVAYKHLIESRRART